VSDYHAALEKVVIERDDLKRQLAEVTAERDNATATLNSAETLMATMERRHGDVCHRFETSLAEAEAVRCRIDKALGEVMDERDEAIRAKDKAEGLAMMQAALRERAQNEAAAAQAANVALRKTLARMLNERGCAGCIPGDRAPDYVRGKNTRLAADEHEGDCASVNALAALAAPADDKALREFGLKVHATAFQSAAFAVGSYLGASNNPPANETGERTRKWLSEQQARFAAEDVDAVLRGER